MEKDLPQDNLKTVRGIGLYKIRYEMDVKDSSRDHNYMAGVIAYTSKEAVDTLIGFAQKNVRGFKGMRVEEVAFEGLCHALSDDVKDAILNTAKLEGKVVSKEDYDSLLAERKKEAKKSIIGTVKKTKKDDTKKDDTKKE
jgi:hypothetical protein